MNYRLQLSRTDRKDVKKKIEEARKLGEPKWAFRMTAILLLDTGLYQEQVADAYNLAIRTIQRWVACFLLGGVKALCPHKPKGRPPRLSGLQKQQLKEEIQQGPERCGYRTGVWTSALIQEHISTQFGIVYSVFYINQLLRNIGCSHVKPKYSFCQTREDILAQLAWIRIKFPKLYEQVKATNGVLLFLDESTVQIQSNPSYTWAIRGKAPVQERNGKRQHLRILGCIELFTGTFTYHIVEGKLNNHVFAEFIKRVTKRYAGRNVFIVEDNAPYHGGAFVKKAEEKCSQVTMVRLSKRSPNLNPIEKLWKEVKRKRIYNRYFRDLKSLKKELRSGLHHYQEHPEQVQSLMNKWEKASNDLEGVRLGNYDSSFIPDNFLYLLDEPSLEDNLIEIANKLFFNDI